MTLPFQERIRRKIQDGFLPTPTETAYRVWMKPGDAHTCDGCDTRIEPPDVRFEVELPDQRLSFDSRCLMLWYAEHAPPPSPA